MGVILKGRLRFCQANYSSIQINYIDHQLISKTDYYEYVYLFNPNNKLVLFKKKHVIRSVNLVENKESYNKLADSIVNIVPTCTALSNQQDNITDIMRATSDTVFISAKLSYRMSTNLIPLGVTVLLVEKRVVSLPK